jgi:hypothetical protein
VNTVIFVTEVILVPFLHPGCSIFLRLFLSARCQGTQNFIKTGVFQVSAEFPKGRIIGKDRVNIDAEKLSKRDAVDDAERFSINKFVGFRVFGEIGLFLKERGSHRR